MGLPLLYNESRGWGLRVLLNAYFPFLRDTKQLSFLTFCDRPAGIDRKLKYDGATYGHMETLTDRHEVWNSYSPLKFWDFLRISPDPSSNSSLGQLIRKEAIDSPISCFMNLTITATNILVQWESLRFEFLFANLGSI